MASIGDLYLLTPAPAAAAGAATSSAPPLFVGVALVPLSAPLAEDVGLPTNQRGLLVLGVYKGSPAETSGLAPGDVIVKAQNSSGKTVETPDLAKFKAAIDPIPAQKPVHLTVLRAGKEVSFSIMRATGPFGPVIQPPARTESRTITVAADGSGDAKTTYGAVLKSRPGDTVLLKGGVLRIEPELVDQLIAGLRKRLDVNQPVKDALDNGFVGVIPFGLTDMSGVTLGLDFTENLFTSLINSGLQPADQVRVGGVLTGLGIQHSGQVSREIALQLKEKAGCDFLLLGTISGQPGALVINVKLMDAATGRFLAAERLEVATAER